MCKRWLDVAFYILYPTELVICKNRLMQLQNIFIYGYLEVIEQEHIYRDYTKGKDKGNKTYNTKNKEKTKEA